MISLKKHLDSDSASPAAPSLAARLLAAVSRHAICVDPRAHADFQAAVDRSARELARPDLTVADRDLLTESLIHTMDHYAQESEARVQTRLNELNSIIGLLAGSIETAAGARGEATTDLQAIQHQIRHSPQPEDLAHLRQRLDEALRALPLTAPAALEPPVSDPGLPAPLALPSTDAGTDPITGLVNLARNSALLDESFSSAGSWLAVPILVDRLYAVSVRYGDDASTQLLRWATTYIQTKLLPKDVLLSWNGKCFVALLYRKMRGAFARREVTRIVGSRAEHNLAVGDREILIPVTFSWIIYPLEEFADPQTLRTQIETFVNKRGF